ncbi:MAG: histidine triad nucleotide-binding protein [Candidatus Paraimprobicoccus trichonymphae]|uniref:Histidine triad nucleotide-binding protein n=1 Tax=Candidatus Paraimprobicoccus trichonymphae TaxID=3033793 RepID=A0AA48I626_9FIRM|nr:MAG: histidine triad nucleotide-binding protein [Candidatus Paraimprobicoccus trichonymphae]
MGCIFCDIVNNVVKAKVIYEDKKTIAFDDQEPKAPVHFLIIPKEHIESLNFVISENSAVISYIFENIPKIFNNLNMHKSDYRIVSNCGKQAGQTVNHLHFHVLNGRYLEWPPG